MMDAENKLADSTAALAAKMSPSESFAFVLGALVAVVVFAAVAPAVERAHERRRKRARPRVVPYLRVVPIPADDVKKP